MKCLPFVRGHHDKPKICVERVVSGVYQAYRRPCVSSHGVLCHACHMALLSYARHMLCCVCHMPCSPTHDTSCVCVFNMPIFVLCVIFLTDHVCPNELCAVLHHICHAVLCIMCWC